MAETDASRITVSNAEIARLFSRYASARATRSTSSGIQARRGWLGPDDVLNTRGLAALRKLLKRT